MKSPEKNVRNEDADLFDAGRSLSPPVSALPTFAKLERLSFVPHVQHGEEKQAADERDDESARAEEHVPVVGERTT